MSMLLIDDSSRIQSYKFKDHFLKRPSFIKSIIIIVGLLLSQTLIVGCSPLKSPHQLNSHHDNNLGYQSELTDPRAKALFAFSEFRMLGADGHWQEAIAALNRAVFFDPRSDYLQLILAKAYLHQQQPEEAVTALELLLERTPESVDGHELMGDVRAYQQNYSLAIEHFRRAIELRDDHASTYVRLAISLARSSQVEEALSILNDLNDRQPDSDLAQLALSRLYLDNGQTDLASKVYQKIIQRNPGHLQAVLEYGLILEQQDQDVALDLYLSFINENPRATAVQQQLGQYLLRLQRQEEALKHFQMVRQQRPLNLHILHQIGLIQLDLERWVDAENSFNSLIESKNHLSRSRYYLAMALSGQGKTSAAISSLEEVGRDLPIYYDARLQLAYLYKQIDQDDTAIDILKQMSVDGYHRPDMYFYLVAFLGATQNQEEALPFALAGIEKNPEATQLLYQLGVLYEQLGQRQAAVDTMERLLLKDSDHPDALNFLAYHQAEKGIDLPLALVRAQKALEMMPSGYVLDTLGWVYFKLGDYSQSREQLEKATALQPDDAVIHEHLGDLYRAMELWDKAAAAYRRALKITPQMKPVEEKLNSVLAERS